MASELYERLTVLKQESPGKLGRDGDYLLPKRHQCRVELHLDRKADNWVVKSMTLEAAESIKITKHAHG